MELTNDRSIKVDQLLKSFDINGSVKDNKPILTGLIQNTYEVNTDDSGERKPYILQKVNTSVFKNPHQVMSNIKVVGEHLEQSAYDKLILKAIPVKNDSSTLLHFEDEYWRLYPKYENTVSVKKPKDENMAFEAAYTFGEYSKYLSDLDANLLYETIPDFHNTPLRLAHLKSSIVGANDIRLKEAKSVLDDIPKFEALLTYYTAMQNQLRPVHYDTKISNVLLDPETYKGVCVIDLDTLMPGMLAYDYGDMVRTMAASVDEEHVDISDVRIIPQYLDAIQNGFLDGLDDSIVKSERESLNYGAALLVFEQAVRFLNDYLQNDIYYPISYKNQNLRRAENQMMLLKDFVDLVIPDF